MISSTTYCVRACSNPLYCPTAYDEMGCYFLTSDGIGWDGVYQDCVGDDGDPPGVYVDAGGETVTYTQGDGEVPTFSIPAVSECGSGTVTSAVAAQSGSASRARTGGTQEVGVTQMSSAKTGARASGGSARGTSLALVVAAGAVAAWTAVT